jgi:hypothetical protein
MNIIERKAKSKKRKTIIQNLKLRSVGNNCGQY